MSIIWLILFFLSGVTGLLYEIVWIRMLALVLGASMYSISVVFAAFMLGLGLGNLAACRILARTRAVATTYAVIEAGIGIGALLVPVLLGAVAPLYQSLHGANLPVLVAVRFLLSFAIILVPTFLIGTTFPVMVKLFLASDRPVGAGVGTLYATNTFGAVAGTLLTSFVFLKYLGLYRTLFLAAGINVGIALLAYVLSRGLPDGHPLDEAPPDDSTWRRERIAGQTSVRAAFFLSGLTALAYEVIWTRILSIYIRGSVHGLAIVLATFLAGLALGSLLYRLFLRRAGVIAYGGLFWLIGATSLVAVTVVDTVYQALFERFMTLGGVFALSVVLMLATTMLFGMALPLGVQIYSGKPEHVSRDVSQLYFLNTLGGAVGALGAGFILVRLLGLHNSIVVIAFVNFEIAAFLLLRARRRAPTVLAWSGFVVLLAAALAPVTHRYINKAFAGGDYVFYREGHDATVAVMEDTYDNRPYHALLVDGQFVAGTQGAMEIDSKMLAHIPLLLHPAPRTALTVGFGSGGTSFSMLEHPLERVDVVEIEPAVVEANVFFHAINFDVVHNPRLHIVFEDARNYLFLTRVSYDVISTDVTNIRYRSNSSLYTREYFELMRSRLNPGGIAAAWIPLSALSERDLQTLVRTFQAVFPHTTLWYSQVKLDHFAVLIGTPQVLEVDFGRFRRSFQRVRPDLARVRSDNEYVFLNMLMLDENGVSAFVDGAPIHTDVYPTLDFTAASEIPDDVQYRNLFHLYRLRTPPGTSVRGTSVEQASRLQSHDAVARTLLDGHLFILQKRTRDAADRYGEAFQLEESLRKGGEVQ